MANTFLNTGMATSNPQTNVNQINTEQVAQTNTANNVNPITIPIQIQPQIGQMQPTTSVQPTSNLQTNNNQTQNYNVPAPKTYQNTNANNNNVVDFNQIYSAYQSTYGTNPSNNTQTNAGVKKSSIGTTIVTPTIQNLNSVEGQYQSAYSDTINAIIGQMISNMNSGFEYDPTTDNSLKVATEYAANSTLQSLAGSGVLNSSATSERVARIVSELIPQYEEKAHNRWTEYLGQLADTAQLVMNFDSQQFEYWKDAKDREFQEKEFEYKKSQDALENAWKRVDELGYVDNNASIILGVKVGTLSGEARLAKEQQEFELNKMREQYQLEYENDKALTKLKSELELSTSKQLAQYQASIDKDVYSYKSNIDTAASKELANYQASIDKDIYNYKSSIDTANSKELAKYENSLSNSSKEYEYQLAEKYKASSSSNSNYIDYNTYDDIIKNRWAEYDDITKKYTITDSQSAYDFLKNAYSSGKISLNDVYSLMNKYGITSSTTSTKQSNTILNQLNAINQKIINGSK